ncbi:hypothetical protein HMPREF9244_00758, partial [Alloscardovia omnicolens F0580]
MHSNEYLFIVYPFFDYEYCYEMIKCETIKENIRNIVKGELCEMCHILRWRLQTIRFGRDSTRHVRAVRAMAFARFDIKALAGGCQVFVYAILYAPRHDVLNTASLGAYFSLIIACFSVLKH